VQFNHDLAWFEERGLPLPVRLQDLANATYAPLTVVQNPGTSSPGFALLLATVDAFGTEGAYTYQSWWRDFARNGGKVVAGWEQAYGDEFTQGWTEGAARDRPIVLSYSTSPAYAPMNGWADEATTANLDLPKAAWHQIEAAGILRNARNPEGAKALLDYLLDPAFQENASFSMVVYPVHEDAKVPEAYGKYATEPSEPASLDPARIDAERESWLAGWREVTGQR
jgi:thiamine transport system substrate-binding protein